MEQGNKEPSFPAFREASATKAIWLGVIAGMIANIIFMLFMNFAVPAIWPNEAADQAASNCSPSIASNLAAPAGK